MRRRVYIAGGAALALVVAFLAGRFSAPVRVEERVKVETKTETVTEWKERIVYVEAKRTRKTEREERKPTGEVVIVRTEETDTDTTGGSDLHSWSLARKDETTTASKVTTRGRPGWRVGVAAWADPRRLSLEPDRYMVELDRRLFGTVWLGVRASTDKTVGAALSLEW